MFMAAVPSAVILEPKNRKSLTVSIVSPSVHHGVMGNQSRRESWLPGR